MTQTAPPFLKSVEEYKTLLDSVDTFLLDCDGVIYHGSNVTPGVKETLNYLRENGECCFRTELLGAI